MGVMVVVRASLAGVEFDRWEPFGLIAVVLTGGPAGVVDEAGCQVRRPG